MPSTNIIEFFRQMMIKFREATKVKLSSQLVYERKNVQTGEMDSINVEQKIDQIDAAINNQTVEKAIAEFKRTKGPDNAQSMNWPEFVEYDPDATAQQQKFNKQPSGDVATNEMQGTIKKIPDEGQTNGGNLFYILLFLFFQNLTPRLSGLDIVLVVGMDS